MHIIIDGYNLLGALTSRAVQSKNGSTALEAQRERLLDELARYHHRVGHVMTVVFDAWRQSSSLQHHEHRTGVTAVYTRTGERADAVIQRMARVEGAGCVVVSSDHEIVNTAKAHGALVFSSPEFARKLTDTSRARSGAAQVSCDVDSDVVASGPRDKKGNPKKLPKAARRRLRAIKRF